MYCGSHLQASEVQITVVSVSSRCFIWYLIIHSVEGVEKSDIVNNGVKCYYQWWVRGIQNYLFSSNSVLWIMSVKQRAVMDPFSWCWVQAQMLEFITPICKTKDFNITILFWMRDLKPMNVTRKLTFICVVTWLTCINLRWAHLFFHLNTWDMEWYSKVSLIKATVSLVEINHIDTNSSTISAKYTIYLKDKNWWIIILSIIITVIISILQ